MFTYEYLKSNEIFNNIKTISEFSIIELIILILLIIFFALFIYKILPKVFFFKKYIEFMLEKRRKNILLKKIKIQKEIEEEILAEMEMEES